MSEVGDQYIFTHIFKCAGNSVKNSLRNFDKNSKQLLGAHTDLWDLYQYFEETYNVDDFNKKFKFVIVRNPYDWLASTYLYIKRSSGHNFNDEIKSMDVNGFVDWYIDFAMKRKTRFKQNKYLTQKQFITKNRDINGEVLVDFIAKIENINNDWEFICNKINNPNKNIPMLNKNPNRQDNGRNRFNKRAIARINEVFGDDFDYFDYDR